MTFPAVLRAEQRWCNYRDGKRPVPAPGRGALTFEEACSRDPDRLGMFLGDGRAGIDIDQDTDGELAQRLLRHARRLGAYVERSVSGFGWHIIGTGGLDGESGIGKGALVEKVEAYDSGRYFIMTDRDASGNPDTSIQDILDHLLVMRREQRGMRACPDCGEPSHARCAFDGPDVAAHTVEAARAALEGLDPDMDYDQWVKVGMALEEGLGDAGLDEWDRWSRRGDKYQGPRDLETHWRSFDGNGGVTFASLEWMGRQEPTNPGEFPLAEEVSEDAVAGKAESSTNWWSELAVDAATLVADPPARTWAWDQWCPHGVVTGLAGPPGVAKSTLALQMCVHHALGASMYGAGCGAGPAVFITVEDDMPELHRRYHRVCDAMMVAPWEVEGLKLVSAVNEITSLVTVDKDGRLAKTKRMDELFVWLGKEVRPGLVVLDLVGDFWDGNENARGEVTGYVRGWLGRMAGRLGLALLVVSHLNKAGALSGSTAWEGSYRSAMVMQRDEAGRIDLERTKANYAPPGAALKLEWSAGYLREVEGEALEAEHLEELEQLVARLPDDGEWRGVEEVRARWDVNRRQARTWAEEAVEHGWLTVRRHAGAWQWRRG